MKLDREDFQILDQLFEEVLNTRRLTEEEFDLWMLLRREKKKLKLTIRSPKRIR